MSVNNIGIPGADTGPPGAPNAISLVDWQAAVRDALNSSDVPVNERIAMAAPPGIVQPYAGSAAPAGWLMCDGSAVSRTTYAALFAAIGVTYGIGDGSTTFTLPNLKGRIPAGLDASQTEFNALGKAGGSKLHHARFYVGGSGTFDFQHERVSSLPSWIPTVWTAITGTGKTPVAVTSGSTVRGDTDSGNALPPYLTLHYLIKT